MYACELVLAHDRYRLYSSICAFTLLVVIFTNVTLSLLHRCMEWRKMIVYCATFLYSVHERRLYVYVADDVWFWIFFELIEYRSIYPLYISTDTCLLWTGEKTNGVMHPESVRYISALRMSLVMHDDNIIFLSWFSRHRWKSMFPFAQNRILVQNPNPFRDRNNTIVDRHGWTF